MTPVRLLLRPLPRRLAAALGLTLATAWIGAIPAQAESLPPSGSGLKPLESSAQGLTLPPGLAEPIVAPDDNGMQPLGPAISLGRSVTTLQPPANIWERIRRGFAMPDLEGSLVDDSERLYGRALPRMTERSRKYLFYVVEELERRGMPTELALLPFIESSYNPEAVSPANAAGMWQFIPSTGRNFDLTQNAFRDDRRDVIESTRAALDYLQKLYGMFGDWQLALAAYNWGEGSVTKAIARNKAAGLSLNYKDLKMPNETRHYVPRLQAFKNLISTAEVGPAKLPLIENHPYFQTVPIERDIDVALAAKLAEISLEDFKALNPSLRKPVIMAEGVPQIQLPWDNVEIFQRNLAQYQQGLSSWTAWKAPRNMKLSEAAESVGMSADDLARINSLNARTQIKAGSTLLVKRDGETAQENIPASITENAQVSVVPETVLRRSKIRTRAGDTLASVAQRHGVSAANLAEWNHLSPASKLKKGQTLTLLQPMRVTPASSDQADSSPRKAAAGKSSSRSSSKASASPAKRGKPAKSTGKAAPRKRK